MSIKDLKQLSLNHENSDDLKYNSGLEVFTKKYSSDNNRKLSSENAFNLFSNTTLKSINNETKPIYALEYQKDDFKNVK